jgi:hypothetical protein
VVGQIDAERPTLFENVCFLDYLFQRDVIAEIGIDGMKTSGTTSRLIRLGHDLEREPGASHAVL